MFSKKEQPNRETEPKKKQVKPRCNKCGGQEGRATAVNLKKDNGEPLVYPSCPADCSGITRMDLAKGLRE